jgi:hypothetical protein
VHADEELFRSRYWVWNFGQLDDLWSPEALQIDA